MEDSSYRQGRETRGKIKEYDGKQVYGHLWM